MGASTMTLQQARLELALWQAQADMVSSSDLYMRMTQTGMSSELAIRLKELLASVRRIGGKTISLGKIIVLKLMEFVEKHPNLVVGIALGAGVAALIASIPFLGALLAPVALLLGVTVGAVAGHRMDREHNSTGHVPAAPMGVPRELIDIARTFFTLLIETLRSILTELRE